jgi:exopolysaccharide production protein ExoQ
MPPFLALVLSIAVILGLLASERRMNREVSSALWIPFLWMFFIGTRFPSQWIDMGSGAMAHPDAYLEGSPIDQAVYLVLYAAGIAVLIRRRVSITKTAGANIWIAAFFIYALLSVGWSDYPWIALKRFLKVLEHVVMALVVLTETNPSQALDALLRRFLSISIVLSVLFLKYYPELGRGFDNWTGSPYNTGVTTDKNALGHICLLGTAFYTSSLLSRPHRALGEPTRGRTWVELGMVVALFWLLDVANAKTALVCSVLAMLSIALLARTSLGRKPGTVFFGVVLIVVLAAILEFAFQIREAGIEALGRNPTLTDRTYVWEDVLAVPNNFLLGTGFESFWLGPRLEQFWSKYWWQPNQAHNGYIETFVNLGAIGLVLLLIMLAVGFFRALQGLGQGDPFAPVKFSLVIAILIFNYTDATFKALHVLYFAFLLVSLRVIVPAAANATHGTSPEGAGPLRA